MSRATIPIAIAALAFTSTLVIATAASAQPIDPPGVEKPSIALTGSPTWANVESNTAEEGSEAGSFDWGDAAIGALSALLVLGGGVVAVASLRRHRGERGSAMAG